MSTKPFRNIALLGATGNLGSKILAALHAAGFTVTAIQRSSSTKSAPLASKSIKVDLTSELELTKAFQDIDVVISVVPEPKLATEKIWMTAAVAAGVRRIVPSEFSTNLEAPASGSLPIVMEKVEIRKHVESLTRDGKIEWNSVNNGPFLINFIWTQGFMGPNFKKKIVTYHDGGEAIVATSTLERIAEGVARSLLPEHVEKTANKPVYVYSTAMSEKRMAAIVTKISGVELEAKNETLKGAMDVGYQGMKTGNFRMMMAFYVPFCFGVEYGGDFRKQSMNRELGLEEMTESEVEELVRGWLGV